MNIKKNEKGKEIQVVSYYNYVLPTCVGASRC